MLKTPGWVVLVPFVVVPIAAVLLSLRQPPLYEASAQVLISRENLATELEGLSDATTIDPGRSAETQAQLARVPEVARRALRAAELDRSPSDLLGASSVTPSPDTDLLVFRHKGPAAAAARSCDRHRPRARSRTRVPQGAPSRRRGSPDVQSNS